MSDIFKQPKAEKIPEPEPPVAMPEKGEAEVTKRRAGAKTGRGGTILAGELTPDTKKKRVLG
jgi:hypothetical protein